MIQKLLTVGSSKAVTVPKHALKELGLERAKNVSVTVDTASKRLIIQSTTAKREGELLSWMQGFVDSYRPVLEALSKR